MSTTVLQVKVSKYFLALSSAVTLLAIRIFTGRQHQIRAHLAHVGHPVLTDGALDEKSSLRRESAKGLY
jgi:23S rRNA pseudouridine955/2504/2580 synthase